MSLATSCGTAGMDVAILGTNPISNTLSVRSACLTEEVGAKNERQMMAKIGALVSFPKCAKNKINCTTSDAMLSQMDTIHYSLLHLF
jgi:hypothetical protein